MYFLFAQVPEVYMYMFGTWQQFFFSIEEIGLEPIPNPQPTT